MENPKSVTRFLIFVVIACSVAIVALSIYCRDYYIVLGWLAALAGLAVLCVFLGLVNVVIFGPILWLMSRLDRGRADVPVLHKEASHSRPQSPLADDQPHG